MLCLNLGTEYKYVVEILTKCLIIFCIFDYKMSVIRTAEHHISQIYVWIAWNQHLHAIRSEMEYYLLLCWVEYGFHFKFRVQRMWLNSCKYLYIKSLHMKWVHQIRGTSHAQIFMICFSNKRYYGHGGVDYLLFRIFRGNFDVVVQFQW